MTASAPAGSMRAAVFHEPGQPMSIEDVPIPTPLDHQVVISVSHCGICGSDLHLTEDPAFTMPPGSILGHEFAGEVAAVGAGVASVKVGDRVTALPISGCGSCEICRAGYYNGCDQFSFLQGGYAQYVLAAEDSCLKLPRSVSLADGALVEPMAVGLHAVRTSGLKPGANVLVIGAGPIGLAATYAARRMGAGKIAVTASSSRRADLSHLVGADHFFVNDDQALGRAYDAFGGLPDVVIECVGIPGLIELAVQAVRPRGTVVVAGFCRQADTFTPVVAVYKEIRMLFSVLYGIHDFQDSIDMLDADADTLRSMVTHTVDLAGFPAAFDELRSRSQQCKVLLDPWRVSTPSEER